MFKNMIMTCVMTVTLTGCVTTQNQQLQSGVKKAQKIISQECNLLLSLEPQEASAWVNSHSKMNQCYTENAELNEDNALTIAECGERIMVDGIRPYASSKKRFDKLIGERHEEYKKYSDGSISKKTFDGLSGPRLQKYLMESSKAGNGSYFSYSQCHNRVMQEKVFPVYPNALKPVLSGYMVDMSAFSRQADKARMAQEDYMVGTQKLWAEFTSKEQARIQEVQAQGQPWANAITAVNNEYQRQEMHRAKVEALNGVNDPVQTNCTKWQNQVNCTTW